MLSHLPTLDLLLIEPQRDLFLGRFDSIRAVADVAADILNEYIVSQLMLADTVQSSTTLTMAKSPRMVPGCEASGFVAPRS